MRFECPGCGEIAEMSARWTSAGVGLECAACGWIEVVLVEGRPSEAPSLTREVTTHLKPDVQLVDSAADADEPAPPRPSAERCPKCGVVKATPMACHKCGLVFANAGLRKWESEDSAPPELRDGLDERFAALCEAKLSDGSARSAILSYASATHQLEYLARSYRIHADESDGEEAEIARVELERVMELVRNQLLAANGNDPWPDRADTMKKGIQIFAIVICLIFLGIAVWNLRIF